MLAAALARDTTRGPTLLAASAGLIWGASDVSIKALSKHTDQGLAVLGHPLALVILVLSLVGLAISARSLQVGKAVPVIAVTSAAANIATIASGPIVFAEPLPDDPGALALRLLAFALVDRRRLDDAAPDGRTRSTPRSDRVEPSMWQPRA